MKYRLHPAAAFEHEEQVGFYEVRRPGLGSRYHAAMLLTVNKACQAPERFRIARTPNIRKASLNGFPFAVVFRVAGNELQVLAIAHHRRAPEYWASRT